LLAPWIPARCVPAMMESAGDGQGFRDDSLSESIRACGPSVNDETSDRASDIPGTTRHRSILILVENLPVPFDRRVWQEATTLRGHGYGVFVICPTAKGMERRYEVIDGVRIWRFPLPREGAGVVGYAIEYGAALFWMTVLSWRIFLRHGFDAVHACNPPDLLFLVALMFKPFGTRFLFDHHDVNPELYEAKFGRRNVFYRLICWLERLTFLVADVSIATNESYRQIALSRGRMPPDRVFVVRSGPKLDRLRLVAPSEKWKCGRRYLVGYLGVIGKQEGLDYLLRSVRHLVFEKKRTDTHFVVLGGGPSLEDAKRYATLIGVSEFVTFTGRVPDEELLEALSTADVCVNPDVANEMNDKSTMNKIMEYMALGKPIVQYDLTEGRFSAQHSSLYAKKNDEVDFAEKIVELLDDPERRRRMGEAGTHRVRNELEWRFEAPKLLAAYESLFGRARQEGPAGAATGI
jgi:glycosyltransferase involved in cell wall biosynthesis